MFMRDGALALVTLGLGPRFLTRTAYAAAGARKILVAVFQRGAADGLSMVVPFGDPDYQRARRSILIPEPGQTGGALDLDGRFGLHPALATLEPLYQAGKLAVVHACGSPDATRSHFDAQDYMETGTPGRYYPDGWMNRHLQTAGGASAVFRAVALAGDTPRALSGAAPALAINSLEDLQLADGSAAQLSKVTIEKMYGRREDLLGRTVRDALSAVELAGQLDPTHYQPAHGAQYPNSEFGNHLRDIAQIVKAEVGLELAFVNHNGWDTHSNQGAGSGVMANYLADLAAGLAAFERDLGDRMEDVVVLTMSEFGRTVEENGSGGTDHGHGTAMLALGGPVRGAKVYGDWPGLAPEQLFEGRDLAVTTDFRLLFGEIVERHLGNSDFARIFPEFDYDPRAALGVIR
jgi:uncharacterized protein (DUF1501 family)